MDISVVIPVYNEVEALPELYRALTDTLDRLPQSAEVVFADDGSKDGSATALDSIAEGDPRVRVLHLSRNYGQTAALMAAIRNSTGDVIIPMDGDGQNDPDDIPRLLAKLAEGYDLVSGWRTARQDDALTRRLPSVIANRLISAVLHVPLHDYGCTLKAYRREVVEDVRLSASSRSMPLGRGRASPSSPWRTTRGALGARNTGSAASRASCSIC
jgi:glycosyltransferase involved in cell wall biosynthesis